jgi:hypothetical protein
MTLDRCADLDDVAHCLVAEDSPGGYGGYVPAQDVQVSAADRGRVDLNDDVGGFDHVRVWHYLPSLITRSVIDESLHGNLRRC